MRATTERPWTELPSIQEKSRSLGLDVDEITRGYALDYILGDDPNAFGPLSSGYHAFSPALSLMERGMILARMEWESGLSQCHKS